MSSWENSFPELTRLRGWIARHRPELAERLAPLNLRRCLTILNKETGLDIKPDSEIEQTAPIFLKALQEIEAKKATDD